MLLTIHDCKSANDYKKLLSFLQCISDKEYARLAEFNDDELYIRKSMIESCKLAIMFYEEKQNGLTFAEMELLFFLEHGRPHIFHNFRRTARKDFEAYRSVTELFKKYSHKQ